jgi:hypothetical protein
MLKISFTDNNMGADFRQFETIIYLPEAVSENVESFNFHPQDGAAETLVEISFDERKISSRQADMQAVQS